MKQPKNVLKTYGVSLILIKQLLLHGIKSNRSSLELKNMILNYNNKKNQKKLINQKKKDFNKNIWINKNYQNNKECKWKWKVMKKKKKKMKRKRKMQNDFNFNYKLSI